MGKPESDTARREALIALIREHVFGVDAWGRRVGKTTGAEEAADAIIAKEGEADAETIEAQSRLITAMDEKLAELDAAMAEVLARAEKAEGDRDALRQAIGFKPGPLDADRDADIVIIDAKALRPAMVEASRARDAAQDKLATYHAHAGEEIRAWVKERFGKWITYKSAWTLADRLFGSERALAGARP